MSTTRTLALLGGKPVRRKPFPVHNTIGAEEKKAVSEVLDSGMLSRYLGCWHDHFYGGPEVTALEKEWARYFKTKHAIAVNSCTSGLYCAVGATGVEPGEEIIVPPYTMSASATAPLIYNALPVFADIEEAYFCLDAASVSERITSRTRAIIVVDLFGLAYDADAINELARQHGLYVIEDTAQAPGATHGTKYAGTLGHMGVYSLNYHKHIHCGEGGVVVTDDDMLAEKVRLIRNHAEAVVEDKGTDDLVNMIGFNFRMTEIEAAIARCQLVKLESLLDKRVQNCAYLEKGLSQIPGLLLPAVRKDCTHAYYVHAIRFLEKLAGIPRDIFLEAVRAELAPFERRETEGVTIGAGYVKPLYLQPLFQKKTAYGSGGFPFNYHGESKHLSYAKGTCPTTERMHEKELFTHEFMVPSMQREDLDDVLDAFEKVWENRHKLKKGG